MYIYRGGDLSYIYTTTTSYLSYHPQNGYYLLLATPDKWDKWDK